MCAVPAVASLVQSSINSFLAEVLGGKRAMVTLEHLPQVSADEDCAAFHEANKPVDEPLEDLDDLMKYAIRHADTPLMCGQGGA